MKTSQTQKGKARCENSIERKNFTRSLHSDQRVTQAICRVCSRPLDSSMHIRCIVTERNEATVDPALVAEFTEIFSKTSPQEEIGYLSQDQIEAFQKEQELAEIADEDDMAELLRQMKS